MLLELLLVIFYYKKVFPFFSHLFMSSCTHGFFFRSAGYIALLCLFRYSDHPGHSQWWTSSGGWCCLGMSPFFFAHFLMFRHNSMFGARPVLFLPPTLGLTTSLTYLGFVLMENLFRNQDLGVSYGLWYWDTVAPGCIWWRYLEYRHSENINAQRYKICIHLYVCICTCIINLETHIYPYLFLDLYVCVCLYPHRHTPSHELMLKPLQIHSNTTVTLGFFFFLYGFRTSFFYENPNSYFPQYIYPFPQSYIT